MFVFVLFIASRLSLCGVCVCSALLDVVVNCCVLFRVCCFEADSVCVVVLFVAHSVCMYVCVVLLLCV